MRMWQEGQDNVAKTLSPVLGVSASLCSKLISNIKLSLSRNKLNNPKK